MAVFSMNVAAITCPSIVITAIYNVQSIRPKTLPCNSPDSIGLMLVRATTTTMLGNNFAALPLHTLSYAYPISWITADRAISIVPQLCVLA